MVDLFATQVVLSDLGIALGHAPLALRFIMESRAIGAKVHACHNIENG